jgi:hypothetical protein
MPKKNPALANAATLFKKLKQKKERKGPPAPGKYQAEVLDVRLDKDKWENQCYTWDLKVLNGENEGRKITRYMNLEYKSDDKEESKARTYKCVEQASRCISNLGLESIDRDDVEGMTGAVIDITLWKHESWDGTKWPKIYFSGLVTPPTEEEDDEEEVVEDEEEVVEEDEEEVVEDEDDDEYGFIEVE